MAAIGCVRAKGFVGTSVTRNSAFWYRIAPVSHRFACIRVAKCSKTLPNIILGLMEAIGCVLVKSFVGTSVPQKRAFSYRNAPVPHRLARFRVAKCSKTLPNIISGLMESIGCVHAKTFVGTLGPQ